MNELIARSLESPPTLLLLLVISVAGVGILCELVLSAILRRRIYSLPDSAANLAMYAGYTAIALVWVQLVFQIYSAVSEHALVSFTVGGWHIGNNGLWWEWLALFVLEDLCFYLFHRSSHKIRILWASHVSHHSSRYFNLSTAFRQTWVPFTGIVFWLPLLLIGFDPLMVMSVQFASLAYQELLHTQFIPSLGPIGWIFNTPAHHAVHHGENDIYIDKNFGGVLIIWDRLFGTFVKKSEPVRYGIGDGRDRHNPIAIAFHEWWAIAKGLGRSRSPRQALSQLLRVQ